MRAQHPIPDQSAIADFDPGLRAFFERVYLKIAGSLILSAMVAGAIAQISSVHDLFFATVEGQAVLTGLGVALLASPIPVLIAAYFLMRESTGRGSGFVLGLVAALVGGSLTVLSLCVTGAGLISTFLVTAAAFAGLSLWGYIAHQNLRALGSFMSLALAGLIIALLVNLLLESPIVNMVLNGIGILIFSALIASDTQRLKNTYYESTDPEVLGAISNFGALSLYLSFVNLLLLPLSFRLGRTSP